MTTEATDKKQRTPRSAEDITRGALSLKLPERVNLVKELQASISTEVAGLQASAAEAAKIASVLAPAQTR